jgi:hypothetical protein
LREWFAIVLSSLAFLVAAATFYFNVLIRIDDVRLIVNGTLDISGTRDVGGDVETVTITPKSLRMTFSNAGNRAVAINSVSLTAEQMDREGKYQACQSGQTSLELEPVQLKPDEISIIKEMQVSGGRLSYKPCDTRDPEGNVSIRVSPVFEVITPDNQVFPTGEPLKTASFGPGHTSVELPIVVVDRNAGLPAPPAR